MISVRPQLLRSMACLTLLLANAQCSDLIGLREGRASASCDSDGECAPGELCIDSICLSLLCNGQKLCNGLKAFSCGMNNVWQTRTCDAACSNGECGYPKSCSRIEPTCAGDASCCETIEIRADFFDLRYESPDPASEDMSLRSDAVPRRIQRFALDRFEVSTSRFQEFSWAYGDLRPPAEGAGAHPAFRDSGWKADWNKSSSRYPGSRYALEGVLHQNEQTLSDDADGEAPVRGVTWYMAFAFCIWDGGRLPTEAEWAYAAFGGSRDRDFPWGNGSEPNIDHSFAQYSDEILSNGSPSRVGTHAAGKGAFAHEDLAGNLEEWVADVFQQTLPTECSPNESSAAKSECFQLDGTEFRVTRGGSYRDPSERLRNVSRGHEIAVRARPWIGFRCARDL